jgi:hypothetical protein
MKKCANKECDSKDLKPLTDFAKRPHTSDGYGYYCKKCEAKRGRKDYARKKEENAFLKNMY